MIPWTIENGLNINLMIAEMFVNRMSTFIAFDLLITVLAVIFFIIHEGRRIKLKQLYLPILAIFLVGVSLGFPLFLYLRQREIDRKNN